MRQLTVLAAAVVAIALAQAAPARAQLATTTFVSGFGFDTNPCTVAAPCRSFQHAHNTTAAGGQITTLDAAGYGAVTITKAISIVNDGGGEAGITDPGTGVDAITISAGAGDVVNLRGLTLNGVGTGGIGINFQTGAALNIQNCVIRDFMGGAGVQGDPIAASAALTITDTIISNSRSGIFLVAMNGAVVTTYLERVAAVNNDFAGIELVTQDTATFQATIVDSLAIGSGRGGFFLSPGTGGAVALINSKAIQNDGGLDANSGTTYISRVTLSGNVSHGFSVGGTLKTFGDNYIIDTNNTGTLTPISPQ